MTTTAAAVTAMRSTMLTVARAKKEASRRTYVRFIRDRSLGYVVNERIVTPGSDDFYRLTAAGWTAAGTVRI